jgi:hypothetical protein
MIDHILRWFQKNPLARWVPAAGGVIIALVCGVPAGDEFAALRIQHRNAARQLAAQSELVAMIPQLEKLSVQKDQTLDQLWGETVPPEQLHLFRGRIVELARQTHCQVRQIQIGERKVRDWTKDAAPLATLEKAAAELQGPFALGAQSFTLSVSGELADLKEFLNRLADQRLMMHTARLIVRPATDNSDTVLEMELLLFEVNRAQPPTA